MVAILAGAGAAGHKAGVVGLVSLFALSIMQGIAELCVANVGCRLFIPNIMQSLLVE